MKMMMIIIAICLRELPRRSTVTDIFNPLLAVRGGALAIAYRAGRRPSSRADGSIERSAFGIERDTCVARLRQYLEARAACSILSPMALLALKHHSIAAGPRGLLASGEVSSPPERSRALAKLSPSLFGDTPMTRPHTRGRFQCCRLAPDCRYFFLSLVMAPRPRSAPMRAAHGCSACRLARVGWLRERAREHCITASQAVSMQFIPPERPTKSHPTIVGQVGELVTACLLSRQAGWLERAGRPVGDVRMRLEEIDAAYEEAGNWLAGFLGHQQASQAARRAGRRVYGESITHY